MPKKIAVIACAMALPGEKGYSRFSWLAGFLCKHGYKVDVYTSTFHHWEKSQRELDEIQAIQEKTPYRIILVKEPGYKTNVTPQRAISHSILSVRTAARLAREHKKEAYDLLYCVIPDNALAARVSAFGRRKRIPVVMDIEDLWPEGMEMIVHTPLLRRILFSPFRWYAKKAYENASAYVGTSDEFRDEPLKYHADRSKPGLTVYVGCDLDVFDAGCERYKKEVIKKPDEYWVVYAGTLGASYDIETLIQSAQEIRRRGYDDIQFKILGGGPLREKLEAAAAGSECNVEFAGYMPYEKMAAYLRKSDITVNSFRKKAAQSIVNKVGDYLAAGKPVINTLTSPEFRRKVEQDGFGVNIEAENASALTEAILAFYQDPERAQACGERARQIAAAQFDRKHSYLAIIRLIESLTGQVKENAIT